MEESEKKNLKRLQVSNLIKIFVTGFQMERRKNYAANMSEEILTQNFTDNWFLLREFNWNHE